MSLSCIGNRVNLAIAYTQNDMNGNLYENGDLTRYTLFIRDND